MLPPALVSVYREYKKDTNSIASWLASTAKECGYPADLLSNSLPPKQPAPWLKGKARAEAKKKANPPQEARLQREGPRYVIEIKDFVPLAECISAYKKPALSVPRAFFTTLNRVIKARSGFGDELAASNGKVDAKSDARHLYFVGILEKVGISATTLSKNRRKGKKMALEDFSRAGPRFLKTRALIHKSLQDRYQRNANRMNWTKETISDVLSRGKSKDKGKGKEKDTPLTTNDKTRVTAADVLASLGNAMSAELEELAFPYLGLHEMSWERLRCVWMACDPALRQIYGSDFALSEWELPFIVRHILTEAEKDYKGSMSMLAMAAGILEEMHRGRVLSKALSKASRLMYVLSGRDYSIPKGAAELLRSFEESCVCGLDDETPQEVAANSESSIP
ncbi:hypothetical protein FPCIR_4690 [Fusarium pseudocircinatum]|uniref:DUF6604 domain-containing protein n=1 Tax=Fusarium pseudocircinatum TaxID=56676 RepID=A0A8H5PE67_9HYPO|nr:hypothetical protein FPCIR_4690 [Fusarium pseudocircinatum]